MRERELRGRVALVTGASAGIGLAAARLLAGAGAEVVLLSEREEELEAAVGALRDASLAAHALCVDLSRPEEVETAVARAEGAAGPLDLLVNNAGVGLQAALLEESLADVRFLFEVNFFALVSLCRQALGSMAGRGGHVINVSSASAKHGLPRLNAYTASKAAVHTFTQSLRLEARPLGVEVSEVLPVSTATRFFNAAQNRAGIPYRAGGVIQTAEHVARCIVRCARRPAAEVYPSRSVLLPFALEALMPNVVDRLMRAYYARAERS